MSKSMGKIIFYLTVLVAIQLYGIVIYEYGEAYGFSDQINPFTIVAGSLALIGMAGWIGRYLNNKDTKRGYCESGISNDAINAYQETQQTRESKNHMSAKTSHEDHP